MPLRNASPVERPLLQGCGLALLGTAVGLGLPVLGLGTVVGGVQLLVNAASLVLAVRLARSSEARERGCWTALAAAIGCWVWTGSMLAVQPLLGFGLDDVGVVLHGPYVVGMLLTLVALVLFPARPWSRVDRLHLAVEAAALFSCLLVVLHLLVLRTLLAGQAVAPSLLVVVYAVMDLVLVVVAVDVVRRAGDRHRVTALLVAAALGTWAIADVSLYGQVLGSGGSSELLSQALYVGGFCFLLGGLRAARSRGHHERVASVRLGSAHLVRAGRTYGPDLFVVGVTAVVLVVEPRSRVDWTLVAVAGALIAVRQVLQARQAHQKREVLERGVAARTTELRELSSRQGRILDAVGEGIVGVDPEGRIIFVNRRTTELLGTTVERLLGASVCDAVCRPDHVECEVRAMLGRDGPVVEGVETSYRRGDTTLLPVEVNLAPKPDERFPGRHGVVLAFRDARVRRTAEQHKHQFVSAVSHELRTPMSAIRGVLEVLADGDAGPLTPAAQGLVETAERAVRRLGRLVDDIIDVERLASGSFAVAPVPACLADVVLDAVASLQPMAQQAGVALSVGSLAAPDVSCDRDRVVQALVNLVGNAVKFSASGTTVSVSAVPVATEVVVEVRDQGRGIPAADLPHVFERFRQVVTSDATEMGGTGLGLTITRSIVQRHGGRIWAESEVGAGSTFSFTLPVAHPVRASDPGAPPVVGEVAAR